MAFIYGLELWNLSLDAEYETERDMETDKVSVHLTQVQIEGQDIGTMFDALGVSTRADEMIIDAVNKHLADETRWDELFAGADE
jgi:hypothetical protein